eukprot:1951474-Rhodomonas_salina.2
MVSNRCHFFRGFTTVRIWSLVPFPVPFNYLKLLSVPEQTPDHCSLIQEQPTTPLARLPPPQNQPASQIFVPGNNQCPRRTPKLFLGAAILALAASWRCVKARGRKSLKLDGVYLASVNELQKVPYKSIPHLINNCWFDGHSVEYADCARTATATVVYVTHASTTKVHCTPSRILQAIAYAYSTPKAYPGTLREAVDFGGIPRAFLNNRAVDKVAAALPASLLVLRAWCTPVFFRGVQVTVQISVRQTRQFNGQTPGEAQR